ncbi:hypothetical protein HAX54_025596, partial [Datura stramonium]|nr:hypothetical protein [Datura stramonium]
ECFILHPELCPKRKEDEQREMKRSNGANMKNQDQYQRATEGKQSKEMKIADKAVDSKNEAKIFWE